MLAPVRLRHPVLVGLLLLFFLAFSPTTGRGETSAPAPAPPTSMAAFNARLAAEAAIASAAERSAIQAEATVQIAQWARAAAGKSARTVLANARADAEGPRPALRLLLSPPAPLPPVLLSASGQARVSILMYHHVADAPADADAVRRDLSVTPAAFNQQMDYLLVNGYHVVSLADLVGLLRDGRPLPSKPVVLTFDDGYDDNYTQAYPILRRHGFSGTFFIITDAVGQPGYASWEQIVDMSNHDMSIQPHGRTHTDLAALSAADATWQIAGSRKILEERLGRPVRFYCYPSGRYTAQTMVVLQASGYEAALTTAYGATHSARNLFELTRVRIRGADSPDQFVAKLTTAP